MAKKKESVEEKAVRLGLRVHILEPSIVKGVRRKFGHRRTFCGRTLVVDSADGVRCGNRAYLYVTVKAMKRKRHQQRYGCLSCMSSYRDSICPEKVLEVPAREEEITEKGAPWEPAQRRRLSGVWHPNAEKELQAYKAAGYKLGDLIALYDRETSKASVKHMPTDTMEWVHVADDPQMFNFAQALRLLTHTLTGREDKAPKGKAAKPKGPPEWMKFSNKGEMCWSLTARAAVDKYERAGFSLEHLRMKYLDKEDRFGGLTAIAVKYLVTGAEAKCTDFQSRSENLRAAIVRLTSCITKQRDNVEPDQVTEQKAVTDFDHMIEEQSKKTQSAEDLVMSAGAEVIRGLLADAKKPVTDAELDGYFKDDSDIPYCARNVRDTILKRIDGIAEQYAERREKLNKSIMKAQTEIKLREIGTERHAVENTLRSLEGIRVTVDNEPWRTLTLRQKEKE